MICPFCNHNNIDGVDECAECRGSLAGFDGDDNTSRIERDLLKRKLGEIVAHDYVEIPPDLPIRDAIKRLNEGDCHCAIVVDENGIVGVFTERDVLTKLADQYDTHADAPVSTCMTPDPVTLGHDSPIVFGLNRMMVGDYRHIPIERDGKLAGVVSVRDILGYLVEQFNEWLPAETTGD